MKWFVVPIGTSAATLDALRSLLQLLPLDPGSVQRLLPLCVEPSATQTQLVIGLAQPGAIPATSPENHEQIRKLESELQIARENPQAAAQEWEHKSIQLASLVEDLENVQNCLDSPLLGIDGCGSFRHINQAARLLLGLNANHIGGPILIPSKPSLASHLILHSHKASQSGQPSEFKTVINKRRFRVCVRPIQERLPAASHAIVVFQELTGKGAPRPHTADSPHMAITDADGFIVHVNSAWKQFAKANGFAGRRCGLGLNYLAICDEGARNNAPGAVAVAAALRAVLAGSQSSATAEYSCHSHTANRWFRCIVTGAKHGGAMILHVDISDQISANRQLTCLQSFTPIRLAAEHDSLTGLLNRKSFIIRLNAAIAAAASRSLAVYFLSLDRFDDANDPLIHLGGDQIPQQLGLRLRSLFRQNATLARFSANQFVLLVEGFAVERVVERLLAGFNRPLAIEGRSTYITASVAVAVFPNDGNTAEELLQHASLAMYRSKNGSRRGYQLHDHRQESEINERSSIERDLSRALASHELWIAFQPQLCLKSNHLIGAECLLRWSPTPDRKLPISKVISVAEESGLILTIGQWVLRESLQQLKLWFNQGHSIRIAVNLSAVQFNQQDVFGIVTEMLTALNLPPSCLKAEITETVLLNRSNHVRETINALHGAGIGLVLDDFGTGYSSLTYLQQFPIEAVKIDASFLKGIGRNGNDEAIVSGIIKLAHSLGQCVVAEGVETQEQLAFLRAGGCDHAQGFLFAKPMARLDFEKYLVAGPAFGPMN